MPRQSAGLLLFRHPGPGLEVFLVHPGGPFWAKKDLGAWSIPKGEPDPGEDLLATAQREFAEETGFTPAPPAQPSLGTPRLRPFHPLGTVIQPGGKHVTAFALEGDCDPAAVRSNLCSIEWPPRSGRQLSIPEVDRGAWFMLPEAARRLREAQRPFLDRLAALLDQPPAP